MARASMTRFARRRPYAFAADVASPFPDSRRRRFLRDLLPGLVIANHVRLSAVARAVSSGREDVHGAEKRLSLHLGSDHWDMSPIADRPLQGAAAMVSDNSLLVADLTDLAKYHARKPQGLGTV